MNFFEKTSLRLKLELDVYDDKEVAEILGLSTTAWAQRKARNSFPEEKLYKLASEKKIDLDYVLHGVRVKQPSHQQMRIKVLASLLHTAGGGLGYEMFYAVLDELCKRFLEAERFESEVIREAIDALLGLKNKANSSQKNDSNVINGNINGGVVVQSGSNTVNVGK